MPSRFLTSTACLSAFAAFVACSSASKPVAAPTTPPPATTAFGTVKGVVKFTGAPPARKVPSKRKDVAYCKDHPAQHEGVVVDNGMLEGVLVRIEPDAIKGSWDAPAEPAHLTIENCAFHPRIVGMLAGGKFDIKNKDGIDHTVNAKKGDQAIFQIGVPKAGDAAVKKIDEPGIYKITESDEPWARALLVVNDHPFFDVTHDGGAFTLQKVPIGRYMMQAWHPIFGAKRMPVEVNDGKVSTIDFSYGGNENEPPENQGETKAIE